jgi:hypothetical protein
MSNKETHHDWGLGLSTSRLLLPYPVFKGCSGLTICETREHSDRAIQLWSVEITGRQVTVEQEGVLTNKLDGEGLGRMVEGHVWSKGQHCMSAGYTT